MSADEYFELPDDGYKYELIHGVTVLSPSPTPKHQQIMAEIVFQLKAFLREHRVGSVYPETDVRMTDETVYRPELIFVRLDRVRANWERVIEPPDLVVEVISPYSRRYDSETKKSDYEKAGIQEYWLIDPDSATMTFWRLANGQYATVTPETDHFASRAVPGFKLDLASVRECFEPL